MKKIIALSIIFVFLLTVGFTGVAQAEVRDIIITSGGTGGSWYLLGAQLGELIQSNMDIPTSVIEGGEIPNIRLTNDGRDADIGIASLPNLLAALEGNSPFDEDNIDNISPIINFSLDYAQFTVLEDSDIESFEDLSEGRILPGPKDWGIEVLTRKVLALYDLDYESIKDAGGSISYVSWGEAPSLLTDGHADMAAFKGTYPNANIMQIESTHDAKVLNIDDDKIQQFIEENAGYLEGTIPEGTYSGQDEDVTTIAHTSLLFVNNDLPDDIVYEIVGLLIENKDSLNEIEGIEMEDDILLGIEPELLHPGARKYYEDNGYL